MRGLAKHPGTLLLSHTWIRYEPAAEGDAAEGGGGSGADGGGGAEASRDAPRPTSGWMRDGEAEVVEVPRPRAWRVDGLHEVLVRRHLLRRIALELFFRDGAPRSLLPEPHRHPHPNPNSDPHPKL